MRTRAINENEDSELSRFLVQIGGTVYDMELSSTKTEATYTVTLTTGTPETFLFWADDGTYTYTDLTAITPGTDGPGIAYAATAYWDGFSDAVSADLKLAVSKVTLKTTTNVPAGNPVTLTLSHTYGGYDVSAGACTGQATAKPYDYTPASGITADKDNPKEVFSFYALTDGDDSQTVTMECVNLKTQTEDITLAPGKHLILTGDVGSGTEQHVGITATISSTWSDEEAVLGFSKLTDETVASTSLQGSGTDTDPFRITSAADLLYYLNRYASNNNRNTYARLDTDIEIATDNWTLIDIYGTFDGNGHTISGTINSNVDGATYGAIGLFRDIYHGTVKNLNVSVNITVTGTLTSNLSNYQIGGISGCSTEGSIIGCTYSGTLAVTARLTPQTSYLEIGGIVGYSSTEGTVRDCTFKGTINTDETTARRKYVNGIVGYGSGTEDNNTDEGTINN